MKFNLNSQLGTMSMRIIGLSAGLCMLALATRCFSPEGLGAFMFIMGVCNFGGTVLSLGLPSVLVRTAVGFLSEDNAANAAAAFNCSFRAIWRVVSTTAAIACLFYLSARFLRPESHEDNEWTTVILGLTVSSCSMAVQHLGLDALRSWKLAAASAFLQFASVPLLGCLALLPFALLSKELNTTAAVAIAVLISASSAAWCIISFRKATAVRSTDSDVGIIHWPEARSQWLMSILNNASSALPYLTAWACLTRTELGHFSVPLRISSVPMGIVAAMGNYYTPLIRESLVRGNLREARGWLLQSQKYGVIFMSPIVTVALLMTGALMEFFGADFSNASVVFGILLVGQLVMAACGAVANYLSMDGRSAVVSIVSAIYLLVGFGLSIAIESVYRLVGLAAALAVAGCARQVYLLMCCRCDRN